MEDIKAKLLSTTETVDKKILERYPQLQVLQEKGLRPCFLVLGLVSFSLLFILYGVGANALCNLVGFIYPLYASLKALGTNQGGDDDAQAQWLTYWIVYGFFTLTESLTDFLLYWIPFYYLFKIMFFVWCMLPQTRGSQKIYDRIILPVFGKYEQSIDATFNKLKESASNGLASAEERAKDM